MLETDGKSKGGGPAKAKTAANALVTSAAVIAAIVGVNIIGSRAFLRADLTQDKIYGLSQTSRDTVKGLPDRVTAKAFISSGLQPPLNSYGQYIRDLLDEYAAASGGKFVWEAIDPLQKGKDADETRAFREEIKSKYKIQPITLERVSDSKLEIGSDNFLGIAFVYGDKIESIPQIAATEGLEYQITSLLRKETHPKRRKIGFISGQGELSPQQGMQLVGRVLQDYETAAVPLDKPVPDDVDVLVSVGAKQPFNEPAKWNLDQAVMHGKPLGLFVDGMVIETPRGMNMPGMEQPKLGRGNDTNLKSLLNAWGVELKEDLILDEQNTMGPVPVNGQLYLANYPTFIGVDEKGFTPKFGLTSHLNAMIVPFASSVELVGDAKDGKGGVTATPIARTSDRSWRQSGFFVFNPTVKLERTGDKGPFVLGYGLEGKLKSGFPNGRPGAESAPGTSSPDAGAKEAPDGTRVIVMGCSGIFNDQQLPVQQVPVYRPNLLFFLNAVDWLAHDDSLINLRIKGMGARPLTIPPESRAGMWRWFCELGIPALAVALGLALWWMRRQRRRAISL